MFLATPFFLLLLLVVGCSGDGPAANPGAPQVDPATGETAVAPAEGKAPEGTLVTHSLRFATADEKKTLATIRLLGLDNRAELVEKGIASGGQSTAGALPLEYLVQGAVGLDDATRQKVIDGSIKPRVGKEGISAEERKAMWRVALELEALDQLGAEVPSAVEFFSREHRPKDPTKFESFVMMLRAVSNLPGSQSQQVAESLQKLFQDAGEELERQQLMSCTAQFLSGLSDDELAACLPKMGILGQRAIGSGFQMSGERLFERVNRLRTEGKLAAPQPGQVTAESLPAAEAKKRVEVFMGKIRALDLTRVAMRPNVFDEYAYTKKLLSPDERKEVKKRFFEVLQQPNLDPIFALRAAGLIADSVDAEEMKTVLAAFAVDTQRGGRDNDRFQMPTWLGEFAKGLSEEHVFAAMKQILAQSGSSQSFKYMGFSALDDLGPRLAAADAAKLLPELENRFVAGDIGLASVLLIVAQKSSEADYRRIGGMLMTRVRTLPKAAQPTEQEVANLCLYSKALATSPKLTPAAAEELYKTVMQSYVAFLGKSVTFNSGYNDRESFALQTQVPKTLEELLGKCSPEGRTAAAAELQTYFGAWFPSWRSDALLPLAVKLAPNLNQQQSEVMFASIATLFRKDFRQHRRTQGFVQSYIHARPDADKALLIRMYAVGLMNGQPRTNSSPHENSDLVNLVKYTCEMVPKDQAKSLFLSLLKLQDETPAEDPCVRYFFTTLATRVPPAEQPELAAELKRRISGGAKGNQVNTFTACLKSLLAGSTPESQGSQVMELVDRLSKSPGIGGRNNPSGEPEGENDPAAEYRVVELCQQLESLVANLPAEEGTKVADALAKIIGSRVQLNTFPEFDLPLSDQSLGAIVGVIARVKGELSPAAAANLTRACAYCYPKVNGNKSRGNIDMAFRSIKGVMPPGVSAQLFRESVKKLKQQYDDHDRPKYLMVYSMVAITTPPAEAQKAFDELWNLYNDQKLVPPGDNDYEVNQIHVWAPLGLGALAGRLPAASADAAWAKVLPAWQKETNPQRKADWAPLLGGLLRPAAQQGAEKFAEKYNQIKSSLQGMATWEIFGNCLQAVPEKDRKAFIAKFIELSSDGKAPDFNSLVPAMQGLPFKDRLAIYESLDTSKIPEAMRSQIVGMPRPGDLAWPRDRELLEAPECVGLARTYYASALVAESMQKGKRFSFWKTTAK